MTLEKITPEFETVRWTPRPLAIRRRFRKIRTVHSYSGAPNDFKIRFDYLVRHRPLIRTTNTS